MNFFIKIGLDYDILIIILKLVIASICGGIIGLERGRKRRPAGFRTHILVCVGSTLAMMTNLYIYNLYGGDPARLGAQVISGIGFLGAGTIMMTGRFQVKGLTTAAGLWASACMGLAIGIGYYWAAIISCFFIWFVNVILHNVDEFLMSKSKVVQVYVEFKDNSYIGGFLSDLRKENIQIADMEIIPSVGEQTIVSAMLTLRFKERRSHSELSIALSQYKGVNFLELV